MRLFILLLLFCISYSAYSQEWEEVELSDDVTLNVKTPFTVFDKYEGILSYRHANDEDLVFIGTYYATPDIDEYLKKNELTISSEENLKQFYEEVYKIHLQLDIVYRKIDWNFQYRNEVLVYHQAGRQIYESDHEDVYIESLNLFLNGKPYTFNFECLYKDKDKYADMRKHYFSSIKIRKGLTIQNQFTK